MSELYEKALLKLELDKVLEMLSACAGSTEGKSACLRVRPTSDLEEVQALLDETTAASELCTRKGNPVFGDVTDVSAALERADRGGTLQPLELLRIAGVLRCTRNIKGYVAEDEKHTVLDPLLLRFRRINIWKIEFLEQSYRKMRLLIMRLQNWQIFDVICVFKPVRFAILCRK